jgi:hypothetical protein
MLFTRRTPEREYRDYTQYRDLLRQDFQFRCAYCLTQEFFVGGESGCQIDHHRPRSGPHGRPDLEAVYTNLYWSCSECNNNKGDTWPDEEEYARGQRFIDPCEEWGDHDRHWRFHPDGTLEALTPEGRYTERHLLLEGFPGGSPMPDIPGSGGCDYRPRTAESKASRCRPSRRVGAPPYGDHAPSGTSRFQSPSPPSLNAEGYVIATTFATILRYP